MISPKATPVSLLLHETSLSITVGINFWVDLVHQARLVCAVVGSGVAHTSTSSATVSMVVAIVVSGAVMLVLSQGRSALGTYATES